jgi:hypothetical protein
MVSIYQPITITTRNLGFCDDSQMMHPCLAEELAKIYSTPTPKGGTRPVKSKGTVLIDVMMFITIAGVRYLYLRLDYESWSNKTDHKTWKRRQKLPRL